MNKFFIFLYISIFGLLSSSLSVDNYTITGHDEFTSLEFVEEGYKLIKDWDKLYSSMRLKQLPKKFMGTSSVKEYEYVKAYYIGDIIFSRSNKSSDPFIFDYSLQTVEFVSRTVAVNGKLSMKVAGKVKKVEMGGNIDLQGSYEYKKTLQETEKSSMSIKVYPGKKMTLQVSGEAMITSGFAKKWFFWMCTQKGAWEIVDIVTSYFELVEEDA